MEYADLRKQIAYMTALCDAHDAVAAGKALAEKEPEASVDVATQKLSASNIAIACSGLKAELMGTISTEPTLDAKGLVDIGMDEKLAGEIIIERDQIRADALALRVEK